MHRAPRFRNKQGGSMRNQPDAFHSRGFFPTFGKKRPVAMIDCEDCKQQYKTQPLSMIECTVCEHAAYSTVEYTESEALMNGGLVSRPCHRCGITTMWKQFDLPPAASIV